MREHLTKAWDARGVKPEALCTPEMPEELSYLMDWFQQLSMKRLPGMSSPSPITWGEMQAWAAMVGQRVKPWQAKVLATLDDLWRSAWEKGRAKKKSNADDERPSRRRLPSRSR